MEKKKIKKDKGAQSARALFKFSPLSKTGCFFLLLV
jgi:hypothetical protein